jgi:hypothetical protein
MTTCDWCHHSEVLAFTLDEARERFGAKVPRHEVITEPCCTTEHTESQPATRLAFEVQPSGHVLKRQLSTSLVGACSSSKVPLMAPPYLRHGASRGTRSHMQLACDQSCLAAYTIPTQHKTMSDMASTRLKAKGRSGAGAARAWKGAQRPQTQRPFAPTSRAFYGTSPRRERLGAQRRRRLAAYPAVASARPRTASLLATWSSALKQAHQEKAPPGTGCTVAWLCVKAHTRPSTCTRKSPNDQSERHARLHRSWPASAQAEADAGRQMQPSRRTRATTQRAAPFPGAEASRGRGMRGWPLKLTVKQSQMSCGRQWNLAVTWRRRGHVVVTMIMDAMSPRNVGREGGKAAQACELGSDLDAPPAALLVLVLPLGAVASRSRGRGGRWHGRGGRRRRSPVAARRRGARRCAGPCGTTSHGAYRPLFVLRASPSRVQPSAVVARPANSSPFRAQPTNQPTHHWAPFPSTPAPAVPASGPPARSSTTSFATASNSGRLPVLQRPTAASRKAAQARGPAGAFLAHGQARGSRCTWDASALASLL